MIHFSYLIAACVFSHNLVEVFLIWMGSNDAVSISNDIVLFVTCVVFQPIIHAKAIIHVSSQMMISHDSRICSLCVRSVNSSPH